MILAVTGSESIDIVARPGLQRVRPGSADQNGVAGARTNEVVPAAAPDRAGISVEGQPIVAGATIHSDPDKRRAAESEVVGPRRALHSHVGEAVGGEGLDAADRQQANNGVVGAGPHRVRTRPADQRVEAVITSAKLDDVVAVAGIDTLISSGAGNEIIARCTGNRRSRDRGRDHGNNLGMAEAGAVGEAHRLDAVPVIDHRFGYGYAVFSADELENERTAVGALLNDQVRRNDANVEFDDIIVRERTVVGNGVLSEAKRETIGVNVSTALQVVVADPAIQGVRRVSAIELIIAITTQEDVGTAGAVAGVVAAGGLHRPQDQIVMAETGTVGEAHRFDAVPVIDHRFGYGYAVFSADDLEDERTAVGALLNDQVRRDNANAEFDYIIVRERTVVGNNVLSEANREAIGITVSTALQIVVADPAIKGIHTVAAIQRVIARFA